MCVFVLKKFYHLEITFTILFLDIQLTQTGTEILNKLFQEVMFLGDSVCPRTLCEKVGSCLPIVRSLQHRTFTNCMHWFPLPIKLPIAI